ncbi:alpha/beta fold hydrolase [Candidatus Poriferisodalis sp.]|uniref:alpha/beta fold hydrolase n=1 Tax=Candidatus Poriferisodalis sp. TaxID=3101277 RepID=UPI003B5B9D3A
MSDWVVPEPHAVIDVTVDDDVMLSVRRHGNLASRCRVLLGHGCGLAADAYLPFWSQLAIRYEIIAYDMRSHGYSSLGPLETLNVPTLVRDSQSVFRTAQSAFGEKPTVGVHHSLASVVALHHAAQEPDFAALVLFDPPVRPTDGAPDDIEAIGQFMARAASQRRERFDHPHQLAESLARNPAFQLVPPTTLELFARSTLVEDAEGWRLRCPPEHETALSQWTFGFTMQLPGIIGRLPIPVKVIGGDPTVPFSFLPTVDMSELITVGYDFVPDLTHFLQVEDPEITATLTIDFLESQGLGS